MDPRHQRPNEYLDDVLTGGPTEYDCNQSLKVYLQLCSDIGFPISEEKTEEASQHMVFLGLLLNTNTNTISIPLEKRDAALTQIDNILRAKKITMHHLQCLTGLLNFLARAIIPGRTFTRRLYDRMTGLKQHHHLRVDAELRADLLTWKEFLRLDLSLCRPFMDLSHTLIADELDLYTDACKSTELAAFGLVYKDKWTYGKFPEWVALTESVTIQTLEMFAVMTAVVMFSQELANRRVILFCDNQPVVAMINNGTSRCKTCMKFICIIIKYSMLHNARFFAR